MIKLRDEIANDPLGRGYDSMTDADIVVSLNTKNIQRNKIVMTGKEIFAQQNSADYAALSDAKKQQWISLTSHDEIDPFGSAVQVALDIWGDGSATVLNLVAARVETISQGEALNLGALTLSAVTFARTGAY